MRFEINTWFEHEEAQKEQPAGIKTSFLIFRKRSKRITLSFPSVTPARFAEASARRAETGIQDSLNEKVWFFDMKGDDSSLSAAKKFEPQYKNDIPKLSELRLIRYILGDDGSKDRSIQKLYIWLATVKDITENDHILSRQILITPTTARRGVNHRDPREILKEIESYGGKLGSTLDEAKRLL